jgi:UDP-glucose 4-epimerase
VVIYDNLLAGHIGAVRAIARSGDVAFVEGDIRDTTRVATTMRQERVSGVMHFAALLSVPQSVRDPLAYYDTNVRGALSVIEAMAAAGVEHFVFSSTAATFGNPIETPIAEAHPQQPINAYGETKLAVERALPHLERAHGIRSVVLRYFNAAGADPDGEIGEDHRPESHLIPLAIEAALGGSPLNVFGLDWDTPDGTCLRDYIHVTDLADAHLRALASLERGGASARYNMGNGRPISVREVIDTVTAVTGRTVVWEAAPPRPGDPAVLFASSEKLQRELGWRPQYAELETIVDTAWRWRAEHPNGFGGPGSRFRDGVQGSEFGVQRANADRTRNPEHGTHTRNPEPGAQNPE